jgi:hypothetical protein
MEVSLVNNAHRHDGAAPSGSPRFVPWHFGWIVLPLLIGCGGERLEAPAISPASAAAQAIALYDKNHDGFLDEKEREQCPALLSALAAIDANGDKRLSTEEIASRLAAIQDAKIGIMTVTCKVILDNQPLEGAVVKLVPEPFMGSAVQPASGVSDANGAVDLRIEGQSFPGVHCGYFRVQITKDNGKGKDLIPPRYNTQTTLGAEVAPDMRSGLVFKLTKG